MPSTVYVSGGKVVEPPSESMTINMINPSSGMAALQAQGLELQDGDNDMPPKLSDEECMRTVGQLCGTPVFASNLAIRNASGDVVMHSGPVASNVVAADAFQWREPVHKADRTAWEGSAELHEFLKQHSNVFLRGVNVCNFGRHRVADLVAAGVIDWDAVAKKLPKGARVETVPDGRVVAQWQPAALATYQWHQPGDAPLDDLDALLMARDEVLMVDSSWDPKLQCQKFELRAPVDMSWASVKLPHGAWVEQYLDGAKCGAVVAGDGPRKPAYDKEKLHNELMDNYSLSTISDHKGIHAWHAAGRVEQRIAELSAPPAPPPSRVKPALAGLGVTAAEDHRLGGWKAV